MTPEEALKNLVVYASPYVNNKSEEVVTLSQALAELDEVKKEIKDRQETEDSLTHWVAELTEENAELKKKAR